MTKIRFADGSSPWLTPQRLGADLAAKPDGDGMVAVPDGDTRAAARYPHPGSDTELQMFEVRIPPEQDVPAHAHHTDEIIYVLEGELRLGAHVVGPGSSVYIGGETLYSFVPGPQGVRFLNFRGTRDMGAISKEEFMAERRERASSRNADS